MSPEEGTLTAIADGIWIDQAPVRIVGMPLSSTMTVARLDDGGLLLHSPIAMTPERRTAVEGLGPVRHLYAPNLYHHMSLGTWAEAFPSARVHGPPGLGDKRKDLHVHRVHGDAEPAFENSFDEIVVEGFRLAETVLFHHPTRTLIVADIVHNIGRPGQLWTRIYAGAMGFYGRIAVSRMIGWLGFSDRTAARRSLDAILALPFERIIVGHGAQVVDQPRQALADAYAWLLPNHRPSPPPQSFI